MSLFKKLGRSLKSVVKHAAPIIGSKFGPIGTAIGTAVAGALTRGPRQVGGPLLSQASMIAGVAGPATLAGFGMSRVLPALGRVGTTVARGTGVAIGATRRFLNTPGGKWTKRAIRELGLVVVGGLVFSAAGELMGSVARRRMNPLNARALRRAIRRVKSARGICRDVESMLPRRTVKAAFSGKRCK